MPFPDLEIDHLFVFVEPGAPETAGLAAAGLEESFRRRHPGQGTANVCYCLDDAYLELLWVEDAPAVSSAAVAPTRLAERADWRGAGTCPFGIAVRRRDPAAPLPFGTWDYRAPFLPPDMAIPVATESRDPRLPFVFRSPGSSRPDAWTDGRAGNRQRVAGLAGISGIRLDLPARIAPGPALRCLERAGLLSLGTRDDGYALTLALSRAAGGPPRRLRLPGFEWLD